MIALDKLFIRVNDLINFCRSQHDGSDMQLLPFDDPRFQENLIKDIKIIINQYFEELLKIDVCKDLSVNELAEDRVKIYSYIKEKYDPFDEEEFENFKIFKDAITNFIHENLTQNKSIQKDKSFYENIMDHFIENSFLKPQPPVTFEEYFSEKKEPEYVGITITIPEKYK